MHEITRWLKQGAGWDAGLALYARYGGNPRLLKVYLSCGYSKKRHKDLIYEMNKLYASLPDARKKKKAPVAAPASKPAAPAKEPPRDSPPQKKPIGQLGALDALYKKKNDLFKRYVAILHQLEHLPATDREPLCLDCLDIWDEIEKMWKKIDHAEAYGEVPQETVEEKKQIHTIQELVRRQFTLRTYISRETRKLNKATRATTRARAEQKLAEFQAELQDIERRLNR